MSTLSRYAKRILFFPVKVSIIIQKKHLIVKERAKMKDTDNLQQELMEAANLEQFLAENQENFDCNNVCDLLNQLFLKRTLSKAALARQASMSEVYLHQVFAGRRTPSRNRLLCLCFGLNATPEETQNLLKQCGFAQLYPKTDGMQLFCTEF